MIRNLLNNVFGTRNGQKAPVTAKRKKKTLATVNESETSSAKPRTRRTVGLTEQRLRARNEKSWMTSTKGWSNLFGRFTTAGKK